MPTFRFFERVSSNAVHLWQAFYLSGDRNGRFDILTFKPLSRMGYRDIPWCERPLS